MDVVSRARWAITGVFGGNGLLIAGLAVRTPSLKLDLGRLIPAAWWAGRFLLAPAVPSGDPVPLLGSVARAVGPATGRLAAACP
jgi:hypothetical protein